MNQHDLIAVVTEVAATLRLPMDLDDALDRITHSAAENLPESTTPVSR